MKKKEDNESKRRHARACERGNINDPFNQFNLKINHHQIFSNRADSDSKMFSEEEARGGNK